MTYLLLDLSSTFFLSETRFSSGKTSMRLIKKATNNITHKAELMKFLTLVRLKKLFGFFRRILFLNRPLFGEIEYSPEANLSNVS